MKGFKMSCRTSKFKSIQKTTKRISNTGEVGFEKSLYQEPPLAHVECIYKCQDNTEPASFRDESAKIRLQDKIQEAHVLIDKVKTTLKDIRLGMTIKGHHMSVDADVGYGIEDPKTATLEYSLRKTESGDTTASSIVSERPMVVAEGTKPTDLNTDSSSSLYTTEVYEGDDGDNVEFTTDYLNTIEEIPEPESSDDDQESVKIVVPPVTEDSRAKEENKEAKKESNESESCPCESKGSVVPIQPEVIDSPDTTPNNPSPTPTVPPASLQSHAYTKKGQIDGESASSVPTIDDILNTLTEARYALDEIQAEAERNDDVVSGISSGKSVKIDEDIAVIATSTANPNKGCCVETCGAVTKPKKLTIELMPSISITEETAEKHDHHLPALTPLAMGGTSSTEIANESFSGQEAGQEVLFGTTAAADSLIDYHVAKQHDDDADRKKSKNNDMFGSFNEHTSRRDTKDNDFNYSHLINIDGAETIIVKPGSTAFRESLNKSKESEMLHPLKEVLIRKDDDLVVRVTKTYESINAVEREDENSAKLLFYKTFQVVAEEAPHPLPQHHPGELSLESISQLASTVDERFYKTFVDPEGLKLSRLLLDPTHFAFNRSEPMSETYLADQDFQCSEQSILLRLLQQRKKTPMEMGFYVNKATQWKDDEEKDEEVTMDESIKLESSSDEKEGADETRKQSKGINNRVVSKSSNGAITESVRTFHSIPNKVDKTFQVILESSPDDGSDTCSGESCSSGSSMGIPEETPANSGPVETSERATEEESVVVGKSVAESISAYDTQVKNEGENVPFIEEKSLLNGNKVEEKEIIISATDRNVSATHARAPPERRKSVLIQIVPTSPSKTETLPKPLPSSAQSMENPQQVETELKRRISHLKEVRRSSIDQPDFFTKVKKASSSQSGGDKSNEKSLSINTTTTTGTTAMMCMGVPHCEGDMSHLKFNVRKLPTYSPRNPTLDSTSDSVTLDESISEGEIRCKCAVSIGEIHSCMQRQQKASRRKQAVQQPLNKHRLPEQALRKAFGDSSIKIRSQRMHYANWVSYYLNRGYVNDSSSAS